MGNTVTAPIGVIMPQREKTMIAGIILAAGESKRMGELKQLLPFGNSTIIETVINNLSSAMLNDLIVVLGHEAERITEHIKHKPIPKGRSEPFRIVYNSDYKQGMLTSVKCGIRAAVEGTTRNVTSDRKDAILVALVDQPFLTTNLIDKVIEEFCVRDKGIILPSYNYKRGHPVIIDLKYKDEILNLEGEDAGLRDVIRAHPEDIFYVEVDTDIVIRDIDYREDYLRELGNMGIQSGKREWNL